MRDMCLAETDRPMWARSIHHGSVMQPVVARTASALGIGACLAGAVSCTSPANPRDGAGLGSLGGVDDGSNPTDGTSSDDGDDDGADAPPNDGSGGLFDVGSADGPGNADDGGDDEDHCKSVDFLFVVDSSISMATNQSDLVTAFPEFVDTMKATLESVDSYHVGVVTSGAYAGNEPGCQQIGALVTQTAGPDSSAAQCGPYLDGRYMTEDDDLASAFECAARVGTGGDNDEKMMQAALAAISPELNAPGACNEGFIREDALLVLVLITDEDDPGSCGVPLVGCAGSPGDPAAWHTAVLDTKIFWENVVVLSLTRGAPGNACGSPTLAEIDAQRIMAFAELFQANGFTGDLCSPMGPTLQDAVSVIESACESYVPVG